jgi:hypothetical protein
MDPDLVAVLVGAGLWRAAPPAIQQNVGGLYPRGV